MGQLEKAQGKRLNVDFLYTHPTSDNRVKVRSELSRLSFSHEHRSFVVDAGSLDPRSTFDPGQQFNVHWNAGTI